MIRLFDGMKGLQLFFFCFFFLTQITLYVIEISQLNKNTIKLNGIGILPVSKRLILKVNQSTHCQVERQVFFIVIFESSLFRLS